MNKKLFPVLSVVLVAIFVGIFYVILQTTKPSSTEYKGAVMTLERTMCYGSCPAYSLVIHGDGRVEYEGKNFVKVMGKQTAQISEAKAKSLIDQFYAIDYFSLNPTSTLTVPDAAKTKTSLTIGGKTKSITNEAIGPSKLKDLEEKIDEVANSQAWVGTCNINKECQ